MAKENGRKQSNGSALDFEAQLWAAADKMRGHMDASESRTLAALLPKLLSDELRVPAAKFMEAAAPASIP